MQNETKIFFNTLKTEDKPKDLQGFVHKAKTATTATTARTARTATTACPCRKANGFAFGWCGVAGGGVPACDH